MCDTANPTPNGRTTVTVTPHAPPTVDENTGIEVTGRYESTDQSLHGRPRAGFRYTAQINRAGLHIEGWMQLNQDDGTGRGELLQGRFSGDRDQTRAQETVYDFVLSMGGRVIQGSMVATRGTAPSGRETTLIRFVGSALNDTNDPPTTVLDMTVGQVGILPRLSDEIIQGVPGNTRPLVVALETAPLDSTDIDVIDGVVRRMQSVIDGGYGGSPGSSQRAAALGLDGYTGQQLRRIALVKAPLVELAFRSRVEAANTTVGALSLWVHRMIDAFPGDTGALQRATGWAPRASAGTGAGQHHYEYKISAVGASGELIAGVTGRVGTFEIRKLNGRGGYFWEGQLAIAYVSVSAGPSISLSLGDMGSWSGFDADDDWSLSSFIGPVSMEVLQLTFFAVTYGLSSSYMTITGDGRLPALWIAAGGFGIILGSGIGIDQSVASGVISGSRHEAERRLRDRVHVAPPRGPWVGTGANVSSFFDIDSDVVCPSSLALLRARLALHQANFVGSRDARVTVTGYASPTGPESNNVSLSYRRARNLYREVRRIFGSRWTVPDDHVTFSPSEGSTEARRHVRPNQEAAEWRRADIAVNGLVIVGG